MSKATDTWWETCEASISDEFEGCGDTGTITQIQLSSVGDASEVFGWMRDEALAEQVCSLLNEKHGLKPPQ